MSAAGEVTEEPVASATAGVTLIEFSEAPLAEAERTPRTLINMTQTRDRASGTIRGKENS